MGQLIDLHYQRYRLAKLSAHSPVESTLKLQQIRLAEAQELHGAPYFLRMSSFSIPELRS
jgi:hypothetical protein